MEGKNTFSAGLNQDLSNSKYNPANYYYLLNGKIITESGSSTGSMTNEKGNAIKFRIPSTAPVYEILVPDGYTPNSQISIVTSSGTYNITLTYTDIEDIYNEIIEDATIATSITALDYKVFLNDNRIVFVGLDDLISITLVVGGITLNNPVTAQTDLKICGWGNLESSIVLYTTESTDDAPISSSGQIWQISFDETTEDIVGIVSGLLVPSVHLKYNNKLNFSLANRIGEVIGRYENAKITSTYFTDDYNSLRGANLANTELMGFHPSALDILADFTLSIPRINTIGSGTIPVGSIVQYCYRLKSVNGASTIISPMTPPTPLSSDPSSGNYEDFKGVGYNSGGTKSVTYSIEDIDTGFDLIEHIVVIYEQLDVPSVYIFKEETVPANGKLTVTHSGNEESIQMTLPEFNVINYSFRCKSIASKRNKLLPANITYKKILVDFDTRAYRFNNAGTCLLYDKQGNAITTYPTLSLLSGLPSTSDAINPYNDESGTVYNTIPTNTPVTWETNFQYKYQSDGTTLGGEGTNVSYRFITETTVGYDNVVGAAAPYVEVNRNNFNIPANGIDILNNNYFGDYKSPLISTYLKGYKRGEVYRFGIVFYDNKGCPSLVNWIGDIRFPEAYEFTDFGSGSLSSMELQQLGIEFTVDVSDILTEISGYSIVRMERKESDKTRLGTGCPIGLPNTTSGIFSQMDGLFGQAVKPNIDIDSTEVSDIYYLQDFPGQIFTGNQALFATLFPFQQYGSDYTFKSNDYLKTTGYYKTKGYCTYYDGTGDNTIGVFHKGYDYVEPDNKLRHRISYQEELNYKGYTSASNFVSGNVNTIVNTSYSRDGILISDLRAPLGLGNKKRVVYLNIAPATGFSTDMSIWDFDGIFQGGTTAPTAGSSFGTDFHTKIIDYCRFPSNQYGGASYESRASNQYISTGHFQVVENTTTPSITTKVFGGDCFVFYYSDEYITMHWENAINSTPFNEEPSNNKLSVAVGFPCEADVNFNLRHSNTFADNQDYSGTWTQTPYSYNAVYTQEPIANKQFISPALIDTSTEEHPHAILASEEKIDGEAFDAWKIFKVDNFIEVDGIYGNINKIVVHNDRVIFYQDRAIGQVSVQDRSVTQDASGLEVVLGTGGILDYYSYITTNYGCLHQFSVVMTPSAIYSPDVLAKKIIKISEGVNPLSDVKGLSAFFSDLLVGEIREVDKTLWYNGGVITAGNPAVGIHGEYDKRNSRVIWTILKGTIVGELSKEGLGSLTWTPDNTTIIYNELMQSFESFASFTPKLYLNHNSKLLSTDPESMSDGYLHNVSTRGEFYGDLYDTKITIQINSAPEMVKTLDVISYIMDLKDSNGVDIPLETFNTLRIHNAYQDTGTLTLTPQSNIIRTLRKWRINAIRDNATNKPRLRDYHFFLELTYNNNADKELILHDVIHNIRPSNF